MRHRKPPTELATHEVTNQPPPFAAVIAEMGTARRG